MIHKFPRENKTKIKNNKQAEEIHTKESKTYSEEEVLELLRMVQKQGGAENGK